MASLALEEFSNSENEIYRDIKKRLENHAKRNDQVTINHHLRTLESHPDYQLLYKKLTNSIKTTHGLKKL